MEYNEADLIRIRDLAAIGTSLSEVATQLQVDYFELVADYLNPDKPLRAFFEGGQSQGLEAVRQKNFDLARGGSALAASGYAEEIARARRRDLLNQIMLL